MYTVLNKITGEVAVIKEKSPLASHIGVNVRTVYRKKDEKCWETDSHIVYKVDIVLLKSRRGGNGFKKL